MEQIKEVKFPKGFTINFHEGQSAKLEYVGETEGIFKYETSYTDSDCHKNGELITLSISIEYSVLADKNK